MDQGSSGEDELVSGLNVTPLVDVVLVLLVVLMISASWIAGRGLAVELPRASTGRALPQIVTVALERDGTLRLDGVAMDEPTLRARVRAEAARPGGGPSALVAADGRVQHARVVRLLDLLAHEGLARVGIAVRPGAAEVDP